MTALATRRSIEQVEESLELAPKFGSDGLLPCITTDASSGEVLMLGWMNTEALQRTLAKREAHYWSRSRQEVWRKGDTSGDGQYVQEAFYDCDADVLLFKVVQDGKGACHTGARSCFFRRFGTES